MHNAPTHIDKTTHRAIPIGSKMFHAASVLIFLRRATDMQERKKLVNSRDIFTYQFLCLKSVVDPGFARG